MRDDHSGEPDAVDPPVRFGGRGEVQSLAPTLSMVRFCLACGRGYAEDGA